MSAASRAKRSMPDMEVIVLEKTGDVSYSACGMPYNIADAGREMDDLVVRQADVFRQKQGIDLLTGHGVESIDPGNRAVSGTIRHSQEPFRFFYDRLLIATGGRPRVPDLPGFDLPGVLALKSLEDGKAIKAHIRDHGVQKAVIIGMGYVGLEMAEALRERGIAVAMIKPGADLLPWMPRELAQVVAAELAANGVDLHAGQTITGIEQAGKQLRIISADHSLSADMVLVAIGISPNSELAADAGIPTGPGNAITVNRQMQTSDETIYAAGDCADAIHVVTGKKVWIPLALRANRAGWAVADHVCGKAVRVDGVAGTAVFKAFNLEVARTGLTAAEAQQSGFDPAVVTIKSRSRAHAHPGSKTIWVHLIGDRQTGRLLGAQMVGPEGAAHRINAVAVALHADMSVATFAQTDLAYAPPFGPVWDPLLTAANQLLKKM
ncbi:NADH oxidase [Desulfosarcina ovata subsp. sediminis]|uniref:NADH oxidase n=2 Tax=Desulfosarcina ovata TaxID=83564 RepID=A0A5K7ZT91_9BACT|nr:NADH oxidase [Desulfosarcina ovata subsp. sediminis]